MRCGASKNTSVRGAPAVASGTDERLLRRAVELLAKELSPGRAAAIAAQLVGSSRAEAYKLLPRTAANEFDAAPTDEQDTP